MYNWNKRASVLPAGMVCSEQKEGGKTMEMILENLPMALCVLLGMGLDLPAP